MCLTANNFVLKKTPTSPDRRERPLIRKTGWGMNEWMNEWIFIQHCQVQSHQKHNFVHDKSQWSNIVLLKLRIAQMIKTMLKGNAGSLNKTYEVAFPSRLHTINCYNNYYIHCYMILFLYTLITYIVIWFCYIYIDYIHWYHTCSVTNMHTTRQYLKTSKIIKHN